MKVIALLVQALTAAVVWLASAVALGQNCDTMQPTPIDFANSEGEVRGVWRCVAIRDAELNKRRYANVSLTSCLIEANDLIRECAFLSATLRQCRVSGLTLVGSHDDGRVVGDLRLIDCAVSDFTIESGSIDRLVIERGHIDRLELRRCRVLHLEIIGAAVDEIHIVESDTDICVVSNLCKIERFLVIGGTLRGLDLSCADLAESAISLSRVALSAVRLSKDQCRSIDLSGAIDDGTDFRVLQEIDGHSGAFGAQKTRSLFADGEQCYHAIASKLMADGSKDASLSMRYRAELCRRESRNSNAADRLLSIIWGDYLRGKYGTSWVTVLQCAGITWLIFSGLYWVLGLFRYGWAIEVTTAADGSLWKEERPRIILPYGGRLISNYTLCAMIYSLENLLLIGSRTFQFGEVVDFLKPSPTVMIGVGYGRLLGFLEGMLGLVLIANFIQAFAATL